MNEFSAGIDLGKAAPAERQDASEDGDVAGFLAALAQTRLAPYEIVDQVRRPDPDRYRTTVDGCIQGRWLLEGAALPSIHGPIDWNFGSRSNLIHLQCWTPVTCLLAVHRHTGEGSYLALAVRYALDWLNTYHGGYKDADIAELVDGAKSQTNLPWYDMAAGMRAYRLAFLADILCRDPQVDLGVKKLLHEALVFHAKVLAQQNFLTGHSNHGFYQSIGALLLCRRFSWWAPIGKHLPIAREAFDRTLRSQFTESGIHQEHSPGYHMSMLTTLLTARENSLLPESGAGLAIANQAEEALAWMIMPGRRLAPFGDTDWNVLATLGPSDTYRDGPLRYLLSSGAEGDKPQSGTRLMPDLGYAFARIHAGAIEDASYLAQMTAFQSRVHKHADHGTFVWAEGPLTILTDPGRYGYEGRTQPGSDLHRAGFWYGDPKRIYVETTRAHNCVEIDGADHARSGVVPFGSGLIAAESRDGLVVFQSLIPHGVSVAQRRILILNPRRWLIVVDVLADQSSAAHDFRQWFKLAPGWTAALAGRSCVAASTPERTLWIEDLFGARASSLAFGEDAPLRGWASLRGGELSPAQSLCFARRGMPTTCFATIFALDHAIERLSGTVYDPDAARLVLRFTDETEETAIEFDEFDVWSGEPARVAARSTLC
jgi:hypothetical protein